MTLFVSCSTVRFAPADSQKSFNTRTTAEKVKVFRTQLPKKKFEEIGIVHAAGAGDLVLKLREEAAKNGGDGNAFFPGFLTCQSGVDRSLGKRFVARDH